MLESRVMMEGGRYYQYDVLKLMSIRQNFKKRKHSGGFCFYI